MNAGPRRVRRRGAGHRPRRGGRARGRRGPGQRGRRSECGGGGGSARRGTPRPRTDDPLAAVTRERDEYLDLARRSQADFENYRKRAAREAAAAGERAKGGLVRELLPVVDNLERALGSAGETDGHLAEGVALVHSELIAVLERNGVEQFDPAGSSSIPPGTRRSPRAARRAPRPASSWTWWRRATGPNGSVLRPARVVVSG